MKTRITELLNIDYPIFQGGMAWVADVTWLELYLRLVD